MDEPTGDQAGQIAATRSIYGILTSIGLICFTLLITLVCAVFLATTLTQTRISSLAIDGVTLNIWKLDSVRQAWREIREQQQRETKALGLAELERNKTSPEKTAAEADYDIKLKALTSLLGEFNFRVRPFDQTLASEISGKSPAEQFDRIEAESKALSAHPEMAPYIQHIHDAYARFQAAADKRTKTRANDSIVVHQIDNLKDDLKESSGSLDALFGTIKSNIDETSRSRIESALYELEPSAGAFGRAFNKLLTTQPDVLTLLLVVLMGVLGSALQITHAYFNENRLQNMGGLVLRICVGAITALVIFIVTKASVPVVTDASKLGGEAPINPYFVSFLAILSGLMSENAIASVQAKGAKFFGSNGSDGPARWARTDLNLRLQGPELSLDSLSDYLGSTKDVTKSILVGKMEATPIQQKAIAIYLRGEIRELFSDLPPATAG